MDLDEGRTALGKWRDVAADEAARWRGGERRAATKESADAGGSGRTGGEKARRGRRCKK